PKHPQLHSFPTRRSSDLKHKAKFQKGERPKYNYQIVAEKINSKVIVPLPPAGAKELSKTDIKKLADDFLKETDRLKLEKYMRVRSEEHTSELQSRENLVC